MEYKHGYYQGSAEARSQYVDTTPNTNTPSAIPENVYLAEAQTEVPYHQTNSRSSPTFPSQRHKLLDPIFDGPINGTGGAPRYMA